MLSAVSLFIGAAGLADYFGIFTGTQQSMLLMIVPIGYMIAARLWKGRDPERPLAIAAQAGMAIVLVTLFLQSAKHLNVIFSPADGVADNLWFGAALAVATLFYIIATAVQRRHENIYVAILTACVALWQLAGYVGISTVYAPLLFAGLGCLVLVVAQLLYATDETRKQLQYPEARLPRIEYL